MLVAQPYGLTGGRLAAVAELDLDKDLTVIIDGTGWYGNGTTFVGVWRVDPHG